MKYILLALLLSSTAQAEPYDWLNNKFINPPELGSTEERFIETKNPYGPGQRIKSSTGKVFIKEVNPYNKNEMRIRQLH